MQVSMRPLPLSFCREFVIPRDRSADLQHFGKLMQSEVVPREKTMHELFGPLLRILTSDLSVRLHTEARPARHEVCTDALVHQQRLRHDLAKGGPADCAVRAVPVKAAVLGDVQPEGARGVLAKWCCGVCHRWKARWAGRLRQDGGSAPRTLARPDWGGPVGRWRL